MNYFATSKITDFNFSFLREKDVGWLEVTMGDIFAMYLIDAIQKLVHVVLYNVNKFTLMVISGIVLPWLMVLVRRFFRLSSTN